MVILPIDPVSGKGWKSSDASNLLNATGDELRKGLEDISYLYEEVVKATRYPASHYLHLDVGPLKWTGSGPGDLSKTLHLLLRNDRDPHS